MTYVRQSLMASVLRRNKRCPLERLAGPPGGNA